jgi:hypothetical protein
MLLATVSCTGKLVDTPVSGSSPATIAEPVASQVLQSPAPSPSPAVSACTLGRGTGDGTHCPRLEEPIFQEDVDRAIDRVVQQRPDLVSADRVIHANAYYAAVVKELQGLGYCALFDGEEIAVKDTNSYNEQYQVLTSSGVVRRGLGAYRATCSPAWF